MQPHPALLPIGLADILPPAAEQETAAAERALAVLRSHGYEETAPPMLEFEESFLSGGGEPLARETFRMMDPASQRMLALRSDMTPQIARIASTRLSSAPRPLRLCYLGIVLRVSGGRAGAERQFRQAGAELIGAGQPEADAEIVLLAAKALAAIGVERVSVDLNVPRLAGEVAANHHVDRNSAAALSAALDRKDVAEARRLAPTAAADAMEGLIRAGGPDDTAFDAIREVDIGAAARVRVDRLQGIVALIRNAAPELALTIDFVEHRGFDYHTGVAFSLFADGHSGELGRGGRYRAPSVEGGDPEGEPAVGFSLFMDAAGRAAAPPLAPKRVFVPIESETGAQTAVIAAGHAAVAGLAPIADVAAEAKRLGCAAVWRGGAIIDLEQE